MIQDISKVLAEIPVPAPLFLPEIPHGHARDRDRTFAVTFRRLPARDLLRPSCPQKLVGHDD